MKPNFFSIMLLIAFFVAFIPISSLNAQATEVLDNQGIVELVKSGLPKSLIIKKIQSSPNAFDLSNSALVKLTNDGVPEDIIAVMMEAKGNTIGKNDGLLSLLTEPGIYLMKNDEASPEYIHLSHGIIDKIKEGSFGSAMARSLTAAAKTKKRAILTGEHANLKTSNKPVFLFYFGDPNDKKDEEATPKADPNNPLAMISAMQKMGMPERIKFSGINSPNEVKLVKMKVDKNERSFVASGSSGVTRESGIESDYVVNFQFERMAPGVYKVFFEQPLAAGEYLFVYAGVSIYQGQFVYDFSVGK